MATQGSAVTAATDNESLRVDKFDLPAMRRVRYGAGSVAGLRDELTALGCKRAFVVTSKTLAEESDLQERMASVFPSGWVVGVDSQSKQHNPRDIVLAAAQQARESRADVIVSWGGGSQIDCGKAIALCLSEGISTQEELDRYKVVFEYPDKTTIPSMTGKGFPHVTIATTISAGEFTNIIGITDVKKRVKDLYIDDKLYPSIAFLDPTVTTYTPSWLWACTGMRAVDHCVETYLAARPNPFTDALVLAALATLFRRLPTAARNPGDLVARHDTQWAAWMSIFGVSNIMLGLSHGIGHQLGARCEVPHGVTSCIMLPHVLEFNLPVTLERQVDLARAMEVETSGISSEAAARAGIARLRSFVAELGLPSRLRDVQVSRDDFEGIVSDAMADLIVASNPRPATAEDVWSLLEAAY
jgi:alcohol dehydrogenase